MTGCRAIGLGARASRTTVGPAVSHPSRTDGSPCRLASEDRTERRSLFGSFMTNADGDKTNARDWNVSRQTTSPSDRECRVYSTGGPPRTTAPPGLQRGATGSVFERPPQVVSKTPETTESHDVRPVRYARVSRPFCKLGPVPTDASCRPEGTWYSWLVSFLPTPHRSHRST